MACSHLIITARDDGVIALDRELDAESAADLPAGPLLELDLADVTFLDSGGLHALLRPHHQPGTTLRIVNPSPIAQRLFRLAGLTGLLSCVSDRPLVDHGDR